jgi:integrase
MVLGNRCAGLLSFFIASMSADVHQFARFIREHWPEVRHLSEVRPEMAQAYIQSMEERDVSGGHIGRVCASLRKLDAACRKAGVFPHEALLLLPHQVEGGPGRFHSKPKPVPYTEEQAGGIIQYLEEIDSEIANLLKVMWKAGLRVTEAAYLRARDIDLENRAIILNAEGNTNRTKGGRPRVVEFQPANRNYFAGLKNSAESQPSDHLFTNRRGCRI